MKQPYFCPVGLGFHAVHSNFSNQNLLGTHLFPWTPWTITGMSLRITFSSRINSTSGGTFPIFHLAGIIGLFQELVYPMYNHPGKLHNSKTWIIETFQGKIPFLNHHLGGFQPTVNFDGTCLNHHLCWISLVVPPSGNMWKLCLFFGILILKI